MRTDVPSQCVLKVLNAMWGDMRVLIVDKEPVARSTLAEVLATRSDIEAFDSADNVTEALDKLQEEEYDILLLDSPMPEMSEIDLKTRRHEREGFSKIERNR